MSDETKSQCPTCASYDPVIMLYPCQVSGIVDKRKRNKWHDTPNIVSDKSRETPAPPQSAEQLLDAYYGKAGASSVIRPSQEIYRFAVYAASELSRLQAERDDLHSVVQWIAGQTDLFFAECSQAEEIVWRCKEALGGRI